MSIDMTLQKWAIFIMGVYGEISHFLLDQARFNVWSYKTRWHTLWKFQLEITSNKINYHQKVFDKLIWNEQYIIYERQGNIKKKLHNARVSYKIHFVEHLKEKKIIRIIMHIVSICWLYKGITILCKYGYIIQHEMYFGPVAFIYQ